MDDVMLTSEMKSPASVEILKQFKIKETNRHTALLYERNLHLPQNVMRLWSAALRQHFVLA